jgi:hypothetical protein
VIHDRCGRDGLQATGMSDALCTNNLVRGPLLRQQEDLQSDAVS